MKDIDRITNLIFQAIDELNKQLPEGRKLEKRGDAVLYAKGGRLDSLQLVHLIVATEEKIEEEFGRGIVLADERAVSRERSPFRTVHSFAEYVSSRLSSEEK